VSKLSFRFFQFFIEPVHEDGFYEADSRALRDQKSDLEPDMRSRALAEVLRRIPESTYEKLKKSPIEWFIPNTSLLGGVSHFSPNITIDEHYRSVRMLYLSPLLEDCPFNVVVAVVVHELAHVISEHIEQLWEADHFGMEEEAFEKMREWGFDKELEEAKRKFGHQ